MRVFIIRHGESKANVDRTIHKSVADHAISLTEKGVRQAICAGKFLNAFFEEEDRKRRNRSWLWRKPEPRKIRMWVSPYKRARQTANQIHLEIARHLLDQKEHLLLHEQQFGLFDGVSDEQLPLAYPDSHAYYEKCKEFGGRFWAQMPLGESRAQVAARIHQSFGTFHRDTQRHGINNIIVVCHGTVLRAFVMMWLHKQYEWFEEAPNPENCSIYLIDKGKDEGFIHAGGVELGPRRVLQIP